MAAAHHSHADAGNQAYRQTDDDAGLQSGDAALRLQAVHLAAFPTDPRFGVDLLFQVEVHRRNARLLEPAQRRLCFLAAVEQTRHQPWHVSLPRRATLPGDRSPSA